MEQFFNIPGFYHIGETILMFLDHEELLCLQCVSRSFNNYLKNNTELWLKKCLQRNIPRKFYAKWKELIEQVDDINTGKGPYANYVDRQGVGGDLGLTYTLSLKSLSLLSSVCYKTTQTTGGVGMAGACPPTSKLGTFL